MCWDPEDLGFRCVADLYVRAGYSGSTEDEMCFCRFLISKGSNSYGDSVVKIDFRFIVHVYKITAELRW